jgi:beta-lactamase regulating signal transducer with metallopeptidase domain
MNLLIEYSLRATLALALAFCVTRLLRRQPAAFRHVIWVCAFGIASATPLLLRFGPSISIERSAPPAMIQPTAIQPTAIQPTPIQPTPIQPAPVFLPVEASVADSSVSVSLPPLPVSRKIPLLEIVWIGGILLFGIRVWNSIRKVRALVKGATVLENLPGFVLPEVGARSIRFAETGAVSTAMTCGIFRPWILLPREHRLWDPEFLRAVLLHELAHVRRRDCLVQWLPNIVCALHWFNPLVWLARSEMLCESERACDDAVIRSGVSGRAFARDLVEIVRSIHSKGDSLMSTALTTKLERRIARLVDPAANRVPLTSARAVFGTMVALVLLAPIAGLRAQEVLKAQAIASRPEASQVGQAQVAQAQVVQAQLAKPAQATAPSAAARSVEDEVMKVDEANRVAKLNRDLSTMQRIYADGFYETNQNGNSRDKAETIQLWRMFSISSLTTDSHQVQVAGNTAKVTGTQTEDGTEHMLFTRVYVKGPAGWQLLSSMQFRNPNPAPPVTQAAASRGPEDEVIQVDEAYRLAKLNRDTNAMDRILADAFSETNQNGNTRDKAETIQLWKGFAISSLTTDTHKVQVTGDTAMVTGTQTEGGTERMLFTRVFVKRPGGWQLLSSMQFRTP